MDARAMVLGMALVVCGACMAQQRPPFQQRNGYRPPFGGNGQGGRRGPPPGQNSGFFRPQGPPPGQQFPPQAGQRPPAGGQRPQPEDQYGPPPRDAYRPDPRNPYPPPEDGYQPPRDRPGDEGRSFDDRRAPIREYPSPPPQREPDVYPGTGPNPYRAGATAAPPRPATPAVTEEPTPTPTPLARPLSRPSPAAPLVAEAPAPIPEPVQSTLPPWLLPALLIGAVPAVLFGGRKPEIVPAPPINAEAVLSPAVSKVEAGDFAGAIRYLQEIVRSHPDVANRARLLLAHCFLKSRLPEVAVEEVRSLDLGDQPLERLYTVAQAFEAAGEAAAGRLLYLAILRADMKFRDVARRLSDGPGLTPVLRAPRPDAAARAPALQAPAAPAAPPTPAALDLAGFRDLFRTLDEAYTRTLHGLKASLGVYRRCEGSPDKVFRYLLNPEGVADVSTRIEALVTGPVAALGSRTLIGSSDLHRLAAEVGARDWRGVTSEVAALAATGEDAAARVAAVQRLRTLHEGVADLATRLARTLDAHRVRLGPVVEAALRGVAGNERVKLAIQGEPAMAVPAPDRLAADVREVVENLVNNALEAQAKVVTVALAPQAAGIEIAVTDDGVGIPADRLPDLFEAGRTTKTTGSGTGLARVKLLCGQYGGSARAASERGAGTTFTLTFPA